MKSEKMIIKKMLCIPVMTGILLSCMPTTHGVISHYNYQGTFNKSGGSRVWANEQDKKETLHAQSLQFYGALWLEVVAMLVESLNIVAMGSASSGTIKLTGLTSALVHALKSTSCVAEYTMMPTTHFPNFDFSRLPTAFFIDLYFLFKDKKKIGNSKTLAAFYKRHRKYAFKAKSKRWRQIILLALSATIRIHLYYSLEQQFRKGAQEPSALFNTTDIPLILPRVLLCGALDFFRKQARYSAELSEDFDFWLAELSENYDLWLEGQVQRP